MRRFFFVFAIICELILGNWPVKCSPVGPKYLPTKGEVWPAPQQEKKNGSVYYVLLPNKLNVNLKEKTKGTDGERLLGINAVHADVWWTVSNQSCDLLTRALERYNLILRDLELIQRYNNLGKKTQKGKTTMDERHEYLTELKIDLLSKCEDMPHYEMDEKYNLEVTKSSVLKSESIWGILRGLETFVQLFYFPDDYSEIRITATTINDFPQYKHRGLLIDTSRHYLSLSTIYQTVDALAMNKMNVLHWHIVDDQSFPYQSERFPTLSEKGAYWPSMVYTKADISSVVAFARDRGVRVIPEFDVPGHTSSWGEAFPQLLTECYKFNKVVSLGPLNPTKMETYQFLKELFVEVHQWFPDEFLHIGGDEVEVECWDSNPDIKAFLKKQNMTVDELQSHFMNLTLFRMPNQTKPIVWQSVPKGKRICGNTATRTQCVRWMKEFFKQHTVSYNIAGALFVPNSKNAPGSDFGFSVYEAFDMNAIHKQKTHVQVWNYRWIEEMDKILKAGHYVIFSSMWYLEYHNPSWQDFYRVDPRQIVYRVRENSTGLEDIVGGEACLWGEMADDTDVLSKTWPRTSAVAERLWTGLDYANRDPVTTRATRRIEEHTCRMNRRGIPAQPPNGPSFCIGAPPSQQTKYYEVHQV